MPVFGLTGNLASGKSTVLRLLHEKGAAIFDADRVIHQWYQDRTSEVYKKVVLVFPGACEAGVLSRTTLGDIVFRDRRQLHRLEKIVHPAIIAELKRWLVTKRKQKTIAIAEVPLLFEKKLEKFFDGVILVYADEKVLIERIRVHHRCSKSYALKRLGFYIPIKEKIKKAGFIIDNSGNRAALNKKVNALWNALKSQMKQQLFKLKERRKVT